MVACGSGTNVLQIIILIIRTIIIINTECRRGCQLPPIQLAKIPYSENETESKVLIITSLFLHALINDNIDN